MRFLVPRQFAFLWSLRLRSAIEGIIESVFHKPPSDTPNGRFTHAEGLADLRIRPLPLRTVEQDVSLVDLACRCLSLAREGLSCLLLLCCELNAMLFHGGLLLLIFSSLQGYLFFFLLSLEAGQSTRTQQHFIIYPDE